MDAGTGSCTGAGTGAGTVVETGAGTGCAEFWGLEGSMRKKRNRQQTMVRIVAIIMAALMLLSVGYTLIYYVFLA